jgi:hypothetical protein
MNVKEYIGKDLACMYEMQEQNECLYEAQVTCAVFKNMKRK